MLAGALTRGQVGSPGGLGDFSGIANATDTGDLSLTAEFTAPSAAGPGRLFITAVVNSGIHIYSITQPGPNGPLPTEIKLKKLPTGVAVGKFESSPPPKKSKEPAAFGDLVIETHEGTVTWYAPLKLAPDVPPATLKIAGTVNVLACDANGCHQPRDYPFTALLGKGVALPAERQEAPAPLKPVPPPVAPPVSPPVAPPAAPPVSPPVAAVGESSARPTWQPFTNVEDLKRLNRKFDPEKMVRVCLGTDSRHVGGRHRLASALRFSRRADPERHAVRAAGDRAEAVVLFGAGRA